MRIDEFFHPESPATASFSLSCQSRSFSLSLSLPLTDVSQSLSLYSGRARARCFVCNLMRGEKERLHSRSPACLPVERTLSLSLPLFTGLLKRLYLRT